MQTLKLGSMELALGCLKMTTITPINAAQMALGVSTQ